MKKILPWPTTGGVYQRMADGSLVRIEDETPAANLDVPPAVADATPEPAPEPTPENARGKRVLHID